jgi:hypothetical protein
MTIGEAGWDAHASMSVRLQQTLYAEANCAHLLRLTETEKLAVLASLDFSNQYHDKAVG